MISFWVFLFLIFLGFIFGRINEATHIADLNKREAQLAHMVLSNTRHLPKGKTRTDLVAGSVVISIDYYKRVAATLRGLIGGEVKSYQSLLTRARREALLRMAEQAHLQGADYVAGVRLETATVFKDAQGIGSLEVCAYGTAVR